MCYLQEMQTLNATAISAGEFLHGPLEVITEDVPVILLKGDDATRPMADRAERFLRQYTPKLLGCSTPPRSSSARSTLAARRWSPDLVLGGTRLS